MCIRDRHRVGRTARMGREGSALVYLAPHESSYVEFLKVRHIDVKELRVNIGGVGKSLKGAGGTMEQGWKLQRRGSRSMSN